MPKAICATGGLREDEKNFNERAQCVEKQFENYTVQDGLHENGKLVLGRKHRGPRRTHSCVSRLPEDAGRQHPAPIGGFTPDQRFFLAFAQTWAKTIARNTNG